MARDRKGSRDIREKKHQLLCKNGVKGEEEKRGGVCVYVFIQKKGGVGVLPVLQTNTFDTNGNHGPHSLTLTDFLSLSPAERTCRGANSQKIH
jgi:hypothetical protein